MTIDKIIAISGRPGLYELISAGKKNLIVQSLVDGKRFPITAISNISTLDSIAVYTEIQEVPLTDVFYDMYKKEDGKEAISHKESAKKLSEYFLEVLPDYDTERVYASNIKKVIQWYNLLVNVKFDFETLAPQKEEETDAETGE